MPKWIKTKHTGVRYREHPDRKHGIRKDRYYTIRYKLDGKDREEKLGWESDWAKAEKARREKGEATGRTLEQEASLRFAEIKSNHESGTGPRTLQKKREGENAKREAAAAERKAMAAAIKTLSEYWKDSYFPATKRSKKETSWKKEEQHFRLWIEPLLGALPLRSIGLKQWDELVKTLSTSHPIEGSKENGKEKTRILSQRSREYITGTLRRIMKHAYDRRMVDDSPPTGKRIGVAGPGNNRRLRVISHEEEAKIMDYLQVADVHASRLARFAFLCGCRVSEAFGLTWSGVDFSRRTVTFPETKNRDTRVIPVAAHLAELLKRMTKRAPSDLVFVKEDGSAYLEAPSAFKTTVEKLGLNEGRSERDRISFHSIRHTVATRLAQRLGLRELMDVMGWKTVQMAMRYVHANEDAKMKALSMLGTAPEAGKVLPFRSGEASKGL